MAFNSIVNDSRLLKAHVPTSKICLLLLLNLLQIYYRFASATIYDRAECRSCPLSLLHLTHAVMMSAFVAPPSPCLCRRHMYVDGPFWRCEVTPAAAAIFDAPAVILIPAVGAVCVPITYPGHWDELLTLSCTIKISGVAIRVTIAWN